MVKFILPNPARRDLPTSSDVCRGFFAEVTSGAPGKVVKHYAGSLSEEKGAALIAMHDGWVNELVGIGIKIPVTVLELVKDGKRNSLQIVQDRFDHGELCRALVKRGTEKEVHVIGEALLHDAVRFIHSGLPERGFGFHPAVRNYACRDGIFYLYDTFPPLISIDRAAEVGVDHFPGKHSNALVNMLPRPFVISVVRRTLSESFDPVRTVLGPAHTLCRMRPELELGIRSMFREHLQDHNQCWAERADSVLKRPFPENWYRSFGHFIRPGQS